MRCHKILVVIIWVYVFLPGIMVCSQEIVGKRVEITNNLNSKNDDAIFKGYELLVNNDGLVSPEYRNDVKIKNSLWNALKFVVPEPIVIKSAESETNSTADYLLYIVGDVKETRAIPYLLKNIHIGGFRDSLARMGDEAIPPVLGMLESGDETKKLYAAEILQAMLEPKPKEIEVGYIDPVKGPSCKTIANTSYGLYEASGKAREKIKLALKKHVKEGSLKVKESALAAYKYVADEEDVKLLNDMAQNDTYRIRGARLKNGERYPLREEAQKALDYIKEKKSAIYPLPK